MFVVSCWIRYKISSHMNVIKNKEVLWLLYHSEVLGLLWNEHQVNAGYCCSSLFIVVQLVKVQNNERN